jgi:hypothetical protein
VPLVDRPQEVVGRAPHVPLHSRCTMQGHMSSLDHNRLGCHSSIDRKRLWVEHHMCPCMVGAHRFGCRHYVLVGRDMWLEVIGLGVSWSWADAD